MHYRDRTSNSDSSYDIVPVPVPPRRHPRAPTTVQAIPDDFDAVTHDYETAATEVYPYDGVTEVRTINAHDEDGEPQEREEELRYSRVYGEWAEQREIHYRQGPSSEQLGRYMEEITQRLQEAGIDGRGQVQDSTIRARSAGPGGGGGGKVSMWREEVARNEVGVDEFGGTASVDGSPTQRTRERTYAMDQGTMVAREVQNLKTTLRRSQSSASQSYRSERMYTSSELNAPHPLAPALTPKPQKATLAKREKRTRAPSPTRSERIYTMAELNALTGVSSPVQKSSPPRRAALIGHGQDILHNRSASSGSPPKTLSSRRRSSPPVPMNAGSMTSVEIELFLAACRPSLQHIAPVLASLGIRGEEHLRALARLREETRDREMKEEMLGRGVTVLEWAILMDKLQGL
ncbi:hypothetical protein HYDPIDRAFT_117504 [Hydnomerulius pinastri MD-312]|uniref:Uncharacterized protein n=1 Tax=Hydnomerulius pinastri MD-312 TaxID=994086 RepID=A0A0C9WAN3_9AGAM|nr:hypothetical protein HYDPIDRAFT_117504 [Hydnomerulius pinastri MD-312]